MCELFGACLSNPVDLNNLLKEFYSHSRKHPHGWGIMRYHKKNYEAVSEPVCALDSNILNGLIAETEKQTNLLAHIRYATIGSLKQENTHPFKGKDVEGRTWHLIHNGTIYSGMNLISYLDKQRGDTDSERVFLYLMDLLEDEFRRTGTLLPEQRFRVVEKLVQILSHRNKLNMMIFDGEIFYVHKNMRNTLSFQKREDGFLFSTTPLGDGWEDLKMCQLQAYRDGELCCESKNETEEFIPTLDYISTLDAMNI